MARRENRFTVHQNDMTSDAKGWSDESHGNSFICRSGAGHECRAGKNSAAIQFEDRAVDTSGQSKVVRVHDEAFHSVECINSNRRHIICGMVWAGVRHERDSKQHSLI
jgi:hypothetical protein